MKRRNFLALVGLGAMVGIGRVKPEETCKVAPYTLTWPIDDGKPGQVLTSNSDGQMKWVTITSAGSGDGDLKIATYRTYRINV